MEQLWGKSIYPKVAIGNILVYSKKESIVQRKKVNDVESEIARYEAAKDKAIEQLGNLYEKAVKEVGEPGAQIFEVHQMMLQDDDFNESVYHLIRTQSLNAEYAAAATGDNFADIFANMEDEYMRARSADIKDISERVVHILKGTLAESGLGDTPVILIAEDLSPSETIQMDKRKLLAFVTKLGSSNSHTAILARTMQIPALIGIDLRKEWDGKLAIVDGHTGTLILDPDEDTLVKYQRMVSEESERKSLLQQLKGKENVTKSGRKIQLYANIGNLSDLPAVIENDAGGIGLFRSEFIYLESKDYPTEDQQFKIYKQVAEIMGGKKVIIRTLDIGADKQADYFQLEPEENPALGYRAIRICLTRPDIFRAQLRALYRASAYGNISIMYPMITSLEEVRRIKKFSAQIRVELKEEGIPFSQEVEEGIMIETPAAALISDLLAKEVDFFSIGTNDLTQYTLAIDRMNPNLEEFYFPQHPAILRMIKLVADNAHAEGIWCGICGELGADPSLTNTFLEYGIDELSVAAGAILPLRKLIKDAE